MRKNTNSYIYGFEDYGIVSVWDSILIQRNTFYVPHCFEHNAGNYIINENLPSKAYSAPHPVYSCVDAVEFTPAICEDHKELLSAGKKLYVHPSCKLSRSMMAEKYKKSLDPFLSDAVVVPKPNYGEFSLCKVALFVNDEAKLIVMVIIYSDDIIELVKTFTENLTLADCINCHLQQGYGRSVYQISSMLNAKFTFLGELLFVPNTQSYAFDILTCNLPTDKTVFEESVQESLGDETNKLTFDSLISIKDMLDSSDENTVAAGLKSLSMMDWAHYPNSVKAILYQADSRNWRYNNAAYSTSVKYMLDTISGGPSGRRHWPGSYTHEIYEEDYELFKQLMVHYDHIAFNKVLLYIRSYNFMTVDSEGNIVPRLKQRT